MDHPIFSNRVFEEHHFEGVFSPCGFLRRFWVPNSCTRIGSDGFCEKRRGASRADHKPIALDLQHQVIKLQNVKWNRDLQIHKEKLRCSPRR
ncbi:hypothetical protein L1987_12236 [Smallanthus sonchifolius]|uniref:Uncharacterized protein n=1 Tax=Smallanthus sonchifolius TaxID=185202 RepID=A0ACB9JDN1_9ASTR|nr:hypothetical protein L1987_12236 [Smallanthus sonchifolius]